ncbi:hypothetical protein EVAR_75736_1 [Eumeta japonica]|uniref:Uncharacterized protein n=1 Tax=Eumeta variegata TaxID=151549 RepID=A0A4C1TDS1_EUMVA|nr:hypothetical protein EVAR_75736_1 [Eumeta japonica]
MKALKAPQYFYLSTLTYVGSQRPLSLTRRPPPEPMATQGEKHNYKNGNLLLLTSRLKERSKSTSVSASDLREGVAQTRPTSRTGLRRGRVTRDIGRLTKRNPMSDKAIPIAFPSRPAFAVLLTYLLKKTHYRQIRRRPTPDSVQYQRPRYDYLLKKAFHAGPTSMRKTQTQTQLASRADECANCVTTVTEHYSISNRNLAVSNRVRRVNGRDKRA